MKINDYLEIHQDDLPCHCRVSNFSKEYASQHGESLLVISIVVEPMYKNIYPHTQEMAEYMEENKDTYIRRALADNGKLYDYAIKE